jgi:phage shock protein A
MNLDDYGDGGQTWKDKFTVERAAYERLEATLDEVRGRLGAAERTIWELRNELKILRDRMPCH